MPGVSGRVCQDGQCQGRQCQYGPSQCQAAPLFTGALLVITGFGLLLPRALTILDPGIYWPGSIPVHPCRCTIPVHAQPGTTADPRTRYHVRASECRFDPKMVLKWVIISLIWPVMRDLGSFDQGLCTNVNKPRPASSGHDPGISIIAVSSTSRIGLINA